MIQPIDTEFLAAASREQFVLPTCGSCGRCHWYPLPRCPHCQAAGWTWQPVSRRGTLYSWTVIRHAFHPELADRVPYLVGLVEPDDAPGVHFVTNLVDCESADLSIGMSMTALFRAPVWADSVVPVFTPD